MTTQQFKPGDRIKFTCEGTITWAGINPGDVEVTWNNTIRRTINGFNVYHFPEGSITKLEKPWSVGDKYKYVNKDYETYEIIGEIEEFWICREISPNKNNIKDSGRKTYPFCASKEGFNSTRTRIES